jgi:DNA-binding transcriptional MerR regulator
MTRMGDQGFNLADLRTRLTLAETQRKNADLSVRTASNKFTREAAERDLANRTKEVEDLKRQIKALERPE